MKTSFMLSRWPVVLSLFILGLGSCKKETAELAVVPDEPEIQAGKGFADNNMVMYWNDKASIILTGLNTPPAQSRYFAMIQIAVHDALNAIKPKYERFALTNERDQHASPDAAVASAAYWTVKLLNIQRTNPIDDWYTQSLATVPDGESKEDGKILGKKAAESILLMRSTDNFIAANAQLPVPDGTSPGSYKSTLPFSNPGMPKIKALHQWGTLMTPFVTETNSQFRAPVPNPISSAAYVQDYNEIKTKGGLASHTRTADQTEIGVFWVERSSLGWNRFARNMVATKKMDAWKTARLFALVHTAMTDAISGTFESKYYHFYWRPETAIRLGDDDGNPATTGDATWLPSYIESPNLANPSMNVYTPPIPDYPSAHASFGGAAAEILKLFFGTDQIYIAQTSTTLPGVVRQYTSIDQAARDNSLSRIYVGFHFRQACLEGESQGKRIAEYVFNNSFAENEED